MKETMVHDDPIPVGSLWREKRTGRYVKVLASNDQPTWTYCDAAGKPEPHGFDMANGHTYDTWYEHRCDVLDFVLWGRFERVP